MRTRRRRPSGAVLRRAGAAIGAGLAVYLGAPRIPHPDYGPAITAAFLISAIAYCLLGFGLRPRTVYCLQLIGFCALAVAAHGGWAHGLTELAALTSAGLAVVAVTGAPAGPVERDTPPAESSPANAWLDGDDLDPLDVEVEDDDDDEVPVDRPYDDDEPRITVLAIESRPVTR